MYGLRSKVVSKGVWVCFFFPSINHFKWIIKIVGVRLGLHFRPAQCQSEHVDTPILCKVYNKQQV